MKFELKESDKYNIIDIQETKITAEIAPDFKSELVLQASLNKNIICDIKNVEYVDSSGLSCFLIGDRLLKDQKNRFIICNASKKTMSLIKMTKLDTVLTAIPTIQEAKDFILFNEIEKSL